MKIAHVVHVLLCLIEMKSVVGFRFNGRMPAKFPSMKPRSATIAPIHEPQTHSNTCQQCSCHNASNHTKPQKSARPSTLSSNLSEKEKYDLSWYVIGKPEDFVNDQVHKITIWDKDYVVWKVNNTLVALDNACSHKSAALSKGKVVDGHIMCPYHGYLFDSNGTLVKVPGLDFQHTPIHDIKKYAITELNDWVFLNTYYTKNDYPVHMFQEEEARNSSFTVTHNNMIFNCYSRILSENSLDIMHIGFVHTFGNTEKPRPYKEDPPKKMVGYPYHFKTSYLYEAGKKSAAKKVFMVKYLTIENEFALPHTTIARVQFGEMVSTIVTFATPINVTHCKLFVKTYRNFWNDSPLVTVLADLITKYLMYTTMLQDKGVVESIDTSNIDGKFNMKFDKLQNTYVQMYKALIHNYTNPTV